MKNKAFLFSPVSHYTTCITFFIVIDIGIDHFHANAIQLEIAIGSKDRFNNSVVKVCFTSYYMHGTYNK